MAWVLEHLGSDSLGYYCKKTSAKLKCAIEVLFGE